MLRKARRYCWRCLSHMVVWFSGALPPARWAERGTASPLVPLRIKYAPQGPPMLLAVPVTRGRVVQRGTASPLKEGAERGTASPLVPWRVKFSP